MPQAESQLHKHPKYAREQGELAFQRTQEQPQIKAASTKKAAF